MSATLEKILEQSFLDYSAFVIQRRSIPDARDMIKYTARQILHAQHKNKIDHKHGFRKSQKSVAAATDFSYVHGDSSCYEQIIRMGRPLVQRYFFEEINGNGGTPMNSTDYSASRYTEARLSELTSHLFDYINENTLRSEDWEPTYDEEGIFPKVLPSVGYYNIVNGSFGSIAPTMISSIPQFNLKEVNNAICQLIDNPNSDIELYPDFASGGILLNPRTTLASLSNGEGKSALIRGRVCFNEKEKWLEIIELPYGVYTNTVCSELEKAMDKGGAPFESFKDLTKRTPRIRIYGKDLEEIEVWLYKNTSVQKHFTIKMIMLDKGKTPKLFTIQEALTAHITHAEEVLRKHYLYILQQLKDRQEIIEGLLKAYSILDDVIQTIKNSNGRTDSIRLLTELYEFTTPQATAIVDLRLHKLSNIDIADLKMELDRNIKDQALQEETLANKELFNNALKAHYNEVANKFGDKRRTEISESDAWETNTDGSKAHKDFWLNWNAEGYITSYDVGDEIGMHLQPDDQVIIITSAMRGFTRLGKDFLMGEVRFGDFVKLGAGEQILCVIPAEELGMFNYIEVTDVNNKVWSLHTSFVFANSTVRGKKIVAGKHTITEFAMVKNNSQFPNLR